MLWKYQAWLVCDEIEFNQLNWVAGLDHVFKNCQGVNSASSSNQLIINHKYETAAQCCKH